MSSDSVRLYDTGDQDVSLDASLFTPMYAAENIASNTRPLVVENGFMRIEFTPNPAYSAVFPKLHYLSQHGYSITTNPLSIWKPVLGLGSIIPFIGGANATLVKFLGVVALTNHTVALRFAAKQGTAFCDFTITMRRGSRVVEFKLNSSTNQSSAATGITVSCTETAAGVKRFTTALGKDKSITATGTPDAGHSSADGDSIILSYKDCAAFGIQTDQTYTIGYDDAIRFFPHNGVALFGAVQWNGGSLDTDSAETLLQREAENIIVYDGENVLFANNLVTNPGAETNTTGWSAVNSGTIARSTTKFRTGAASFLVTRGSADIAAQYANISISPSTHYEFTAWVKNVTGTSCGITVNWRTGADADISSTTSTNVSTPFGWTLIKIAELSPATAGIARLQLRVPGSTGNTAYFDDICLMSNANALNTNDAAQWVGAANVTDIAIVPGIYGDAISWSTDGASTKISTINTERLVDLSPYTHCSAWVKHTASSDRFFSLWLTTPSGESAQLNSVMVQPNMWTCVSWNISSVVRDRVSVLSFASSETDIGVTRYLDNIVFGEFDRVGGGEVGVVSDFEPNGLALWYRGTQTGTTLDELSGAGTNPATLTNQYFFIDSKYTRAVRFDGLNDYLVLPYHSSMLFPGNFTIAFWAKKHGPGTGTSPSIIEKGGGSAVGVGFSIYSSSDGTLTFRRDNIATCVTAAGALTTTEFNHFLLVHDGATTAWYKNGVASGTARSGTWAADTVAQNATVGINANISMDDLRMYSRALTTTEITALASAVTAPTDDFTTTVGWWQLNEASQVTTFVDSTPSPLNLTYGSRPLDNASPKFNNTCARFDGWDDFIDLTTATATALLGDKSIGAWVKPINIQGSLQALIATGNGAGTVGSDAGWAFGWIASGYLSMSVSNGTTTQTISATNLPLNIGVWTHVLLTYVSSTMTPVFYVNGVATTKSATSFTLTHGTGDRCCVGSEGDYGAGLGSEFAIDAFVDNLRLYTRTLTAAEALGLSTWSTAIDSTHSTNSQYAHYTMETSTNAVPGQPALSTIVDTHWASGANDFKHIAAVHLDGGNNYINAASNGGELQSNNFTVAFWIRLNKNPDTSTVTDVYLLSGFTNSINPTPWSVYLQQDRTIGFSVQVGGVNYTSIDNTVAGESLTVGTWAHVAYAYNAATGFGYAWKDGVSTRSGVMKTISAGTAVTASGSTPWNLSGTSSNALTIGVSSGTSPLSPPATIDDYRYYNAALTTAQVAALTGTTLVDGTHSFLRHWVSFDTWTGANFHNWGSDTSSFVSSPSPPPTAAGKHGLAYNPDGVDDFLTFPSAPFGSGSDAFTASFWVYIPSVANFSTLGVIYSDENSVGSGTQMAIDGTLGGPSFARFIASVNRSNITRTMPSSTADVPRESWSHICVTWDGSGSGVFTLTINGVALSLTTSSSTALTGSRNAMATMGKRFNGFFFKGMIDDFRMYRQVLTATEIGALYNAMPSNLKRYYPFNETSGTTIADASIGYYLNGGVRDAVYNTGAFWTRSTSETGGNGQFDKSLVTSFANSYRTATALTALGSDWTLAAWVRPSFIGANSRRQVILSSTDDRPQVYAESNGTSLRFALSWRTTTPSIVTITEAAYTRAVDTWYHVVATHTNTGPSTVLYVNGVSVGTNGANNSESVPSTQWMIGNSTTTPTTQGFSGFIEEVRLYGRALNATDVAALYQVNPSQRRSLYDFEESSSMATTFTDGFATLNGVWNTAQTPRSGTLDYALAGKYGNCVRFGGNDYAFVADTAGSKLDISTNITLAAWVYLDRAYQSHYIFGKYAAWGLYIQSSATPAGVFWKASDSAISSVVAPSAIPLATWTHIAMTYDGTTQRLYVNGTQVATTAVTNTIAVNDLPLCIGAFSTNTTTYDYPIDGGVDDVRIYNRTLSATEITQVMNLDVQNRLCYFKFDETTGVTVANSDGAWAAGTINGTGVSTTTARANTWLIPTFGGNSVYRTSANYSWTTEHSLEAWVKPTNVTNQTGSIIFLSNEASLPYLGLSGGGRFIYSLRKSDMTQATLGETDGLIDASFTITASQWYHVVGTSKEGEQCLYVNGALYAKTAYSVAQPNAAPISIGGFNIVSGLSLTSDYLFNGAMEGVRVYTRALTSGEVRRNYSYGQNVHGWFAGTTGTRIGLSPTSVEGTRSFEIATVADSIMRKNFDYPQNWSNYSTLTYYVNRLAGSSNTVQVILRSGTGSATWDVIHATTAAWVRERDESAIALASPTSTSGTFDLTRVTSIEIANIDTGTLFDVMTLSGSQVVSVGEWQSEVNTDASAGAFLTNSASPASGDALTYNIDAPVPGFYRIAFRVYDTADSYSNGWKVTVGASTVVYDVAEAAGTGMDFITFLTAPVQLGDGPTTVKFETKNATKHGFDSFTLVPLFRDVNTPATDEFPIDIINAELHRVTVRRDVVPLEET